jgi:pimeloyl-ACP methyl ester carboxylesterase
MHGAIGSPGWHSPQLDAAVRSLGIRYLAVNRPGFGGSDPSPGRTVADHAGDVEELADALGVKRFSVIAVSAGGPFALACAWALPDRVVAAAAASPLAPACGVAGSPSLRYRVPGAGFRVPLAGPLTYDVVLRALHARSATAPRNMVEDYEVCRRPWGFEPSEVTVPVVLWHGLSDRLVPVRHALRLAAALPACATCLEPRAGHFFFSRRVGEIIGSVLGTRRIDHHTNVAGVADRLPACDGTGPGILGEARTSGRVRPTPLYRSAKGGVDAKSRYARLSRHTPDGRSSAGPLAEVQPGPRRFVR